MTQPADNINLITSRHVLKDVIHTNDVVHCAADRDIQTQCTEWDGQDEETTKEHNQVAKQSCQTCRDQRYYQFCCELSNIQYIEQQNTKSYFNILQHVKELLILLLPSSKQL
jgi:hypothetical protein